MIDKSLHRKITEKAQNNDNFLNKCFSEGKMSLKNIMSQNLITVEMDDDLNKVQDLFNQHNIHHILVTDAKKLVGVLTDCDLYKHLSPNIGTRKETHADISLLHQKAHQIMCRKLITASSSMGIYDAILKLHDHHISCLPIIDSDNKPIGIITWRDILAIIAKQHRQRMKA